MINETIKPLILTIIAFGTFGLLGGTARYINDLGKLEDPKFKAMKYLAETIVAIIISTFVGLLASYLSLPDNALYGLVGLAGYSYKEITNVMPEIIKARLSK